MTLSTPIDGAPPDAAPATLGDVLYAKGPARLLEKDWVDLVSAAARGDQAALIALYDRAHRPVFTLIMRITHDRQAAEELTLDVFHDVWRRSSAYDAASGTVLGWIMNQARSRAIDRLRYEGRKRRVGSGELDLQAELSVHGPDRTLERQHEQDKLRRALEVLNPDERLAIETAYFSDLSYADVAARLGEPLGTIKTRIRSGLAKLRQRLAGREEP